MPVPLPNYRAQLLAGHDGDTTVFLADRLDRRTREVLAVRFADVRAPEVKPMQPGGAETRAFVNGWLADVITRNNAARRARVWPFIVCCQLTTGTEPERRESFDRVIGWVYEAATGVCLNDDVNAFLAEHGDWPAGKLRYEP